MSLIFDERHEGGSLVLTVAGELDLYTAPQFSSRLLAALVAAAGATGAGEGAAPAGGLVLDLSGVPFMDSAGLGVLVGGYKRARSDRTPLVLAGVTEQVSRLFEITGLSRVLDVCPSVADAGRRGA